MSYYDSQGRRIPLYGLITSPVLRRKTDRLHPDLRWVHIKNLAHAVYMYKGHILRTFCGKRVINPVPTSPYYENTVVRILEEDVKGRHKTCRRCKMSIENFHQTETFFPPMEAKDGREL